MGRFDKALKERIMILEKVKALNIDPSITNPVSYTKYSMGKRIEYCWNKIGKVHDNETMSMEHKVLQILDIMQTLQKNYDEFMALAMDHYDDFEDYLYKDVIVEIETMH